MKEPWVPWDFPHFSVRFPRQPSPLSPTPAFLYGVHGTLSAPAELAISPFPCGECRQGSWRAARGTATRLCPWNALSPSWRQDMQQVLGMGQWAVEQRCWWQAVSSRMAWWMLQSQSRQGKIWSWSRWGGASCHWRPLTAGFHTCPFWQTLRSWLPPLQIQKSIWTLFKGVRSWRSHNFFCLFILVVNPLSLIKSL